MNDKSHSHMKPNPGWFPKGRTGNRNGRPRASRAAKASVFEVLADMTLTVTGPGGTREMTVEEALQQRTYQDALKGKRIAMREVAKWIIKREEWLEKHASKPSGPERLPPLLTSSDPHNADAALQLLGIAAHDPARADWGADRQQLLLEPWAVEAAFRRRRGGQRLTDKELENIRHRTRDPDSLRWPRGTSE